MQDNGKVEKTSASDVAASDAVSAAASVQPTPEPPDHPSHATRWSDRLDAWLFSPPHRFESVLKAVMTRLNARIDSKG